MTPSHINFQHITLVSIPLEQLTMLIAVLANLVHHRVATLECDL